MACAFLRCSIRFASGFFACLLLVALVSPANAETPTRLDEVLGAGVLRVGLTEDYRPFSFPDASDKVEGIDVDMAMSLAQSLGVKLEIVKTSWSTLKSDLEGNSFDIAMGGITITLDRQKVGLFSNPVFSDGKTPITHCGELFHGTPALRGKTTEHPFSSRLNHNHAIPLVFARPTASSIGAGSSSFSTNRSRRSGSSRCAEASIPSSRCEIAASRC
jgi:ABC-type amino acid transport substrate-binding protein